MRYVVVLGAGLSALAFSFSAAAQGAVALGAEQSTALYPSAATRPIPVADQLWRKAVWRTLDLREKANRPLFAQGHWVTTVIIEAVKRGELVPYRTDSCTRELTREEFIARLRLPNSEPAVSSAEQAAGFGAADFGVESDWVAASGTPASPRSRAQASRSTGGVEVPVRSASAVELLPRQLWQLDVKEQLTFDKRRSQMKHYLEAVTIVIPAAETAKGFDLPLASFRYADLVRVFRAHPTEAIWFNAQNSAQHRNLADAFDLWLFHGRITKIENPDDKDLVALNGGERAALFAGQEAAATLIEFEDQLWSR